MGIINIDSSAIEPTMSKKPDVIIELSEENVSQSNYSRYKKTDKKEDDPKEVLGLYHRIDQEELEKRGLAHKSELNKEQGGLKSLHQFSMLQRFRSGKSYNAPDRYVSR